MSTDDLLRDIHHDVRETSVLVSALDERSKAHTSQIKTIQLDVKSVQKTVSRLDERTSTQTDDIKTLETEARRTAGKAGLLTGTGAGGTVLLLSKLWGWLNGSHP